MTMPCKYVAPRVAARVKLAGLGCRRSARKSTAKFRTLIDTRDPPSTYRLQNAVAPSSPMTRFSA